METRDSVGLEARQVMQAQRNFERLKGARLVTLSTVENREG